MTYFGITWIAEHWIAIIGSEKHTYSVNSCHQLTGQLFLIGRFWLATSDTSKNRSTTILTHNANSNVE